MNTQIQKQNTFSLTPSNLQEAIKFAEIMAKSTIVPKDYQNKSGNILVAIQMGAELGLKPIQSLQNIAVINGRPSVFGDSLLALVQTSSVFEDIEETFDEKTYTAYCCVKRKGHSKYTMSFSKEDAEKASLWGKSGPWTAYPKRMLQMRARGFALRDKFADVLGGLITAEEARDIPSDDTSNNMKVVQDNAYKEEDSIAVESRLDSFIEQENVSNVVNSLEVKTDKVAELQELLAISNIPDTTIEKWCSAYNISTLEELPEDKLVACIEHIKSNAVSVENIASNSS